MFLKKGSTRGLLASSLLVLFTHCAHALVNVAKAGASVTSSVSTGGTRLVLLFASDLHGQLRPDLVNGGGYARMGAFIKSEKQKVDAQTDILAVYGGDAAGKSALPCRKTEEKECMPLLKEMGFDLAVLGNGELKRSSSEINGLINASGISWISANSASSKSFPTLWKYGYRYRGPKTGADIHFVGWSVEPSPGEIPKAKLDHSTFNNPTPQLWNQIKQEIGNRPLVWLTHTALETDQLLLNESCKRGFNPIVLLKAHTHQHREGREACAPWFEPGPFGEYISRVTLEKASDQPGGWKLIGHEFIKLGPELPEDAAIKTKIAELYKKFAPEADDVMGTVLGSRTQDQAAQWLADTYKKVSQADVAIVNSGAVKMGMDPGPLTREKLMTVIPYNNDLMGTDISEAEFSKALCKASMRARDVFDDDGGEIILGGSKLVGAGTPTCHLESPRRGRLKLVMDSYLLGRSGRWLGIDLKSRSFKFGMDTQQALKRGLDLGGKRL